MAFDQQDERYQHLSAEEMGIVEKSVSEALAWMNAKMNAQSKLKIAQDPAVKVADIIQKIQVCAAFLVKTANTSSYLKIK